MNNILNNTQLFPNIQDLRVHKQQEYRDLIKKYPQLIEDPYFVIQNIAASCLSLSQYPQQIRENILFLQSYFSNIEADPKEYSAIPEELLKNPIFINTVVVKNPDIYLLADSKAVNDYTLGIIQHYHSGKLLKYVSSEKLEDLQFCKNAIKINKENFAYLPDIFKTDLEILKKVFQENFYINGQPLTKYLTKEQKKDTTFVKNLVLNYNLGCFPYLPKNYYNDKDFCEEVISKQSEYFKILSVELKNDHGWVIDLLNKPQYHNSNNLEKFNRIDIISQLSLDYFTEDFCRMHSSTLSKNFQFLTKEQASLPLVLKYSFQAEDIVKNFAFATSTAYLNHVGHIGLRQALKDLYKEHKAFNKVYWEEDSKLAFAKEAQILADKYIFFEKLNDIIPNKEETIHKKNKL